jgi:hypothetical protein
MENVVKKILDMLNSLVAFLKKKATDLNLYHPQSSQNDANNKNSSNNAFSNNKKASDFSSETKKKSSSNNSNNQSSSRSSKKSSTNTNEHIAKVNSLKKVNNPEVLRNHPRLQEYVKPNISEKRQNLGKSPKDPKLDAFKKDQLKKQVIIQIEKNIEYLGDLSIALSNEGYYDYDVKVIELIQQSRGCLNIIRRLGVDKIYFDKTYQAIKEHTANIATLLET